MMSRSAGRAQYLFAATVSLLWQMADRHRVRRAANSANDRGDVPGWVMITMMTAIVVIVLLGVFQDAVVTAVKNAFDSIGGQGD